MATDNRLKFCVVQFMDLPYNSIEQYVCVPNSWVRTRNAMTVQVAYPKEDPAKTRERVKNEEPVDKDWKHFKAIVELDTGTLQIFFSPCFALGFLCVFPQTGRPVTTLTARLSQRLSDRLLRVCRGFDSPTEQLFV